MPDRLLNFDAIENELRERRRVGQKMAALISGINERVSTVSVSFLLRQWDDIEQQPPRLPKEDGK